MRGARRAWVQNPCVNHTLMFSVVEVGEIENAGTASVADARPLGVDFFRSSGSGTFRCVACGLDSSLGAVLVAVG